MNCTECKGSGFVSQTTSSLDGSPCNINVSCFACAGTGLGTTVCCIMCEKEMPRQHPGQFMCGNPECRAKIVKIVEAHKMEMRKYVRVIEDGKGAVLPLVDDAKEVAEAAMNAGTVLT
jgi:hypothetical protein